MHPGESALLGKLKDPRQLSELRAVDAEGLDECCLAFFSVGRRM
jgi:hypothetical protein